MKIKTLALTLGLLGIQFSSFGGITSYQPGHLPTVLYATESGGAAYDGETVSPFAKAILSSLATDNKNLSQYDFLSTVRKTYAKNQSRVNSYLENPWIDDKQSLCGKGTTYIITIGINDYPDNTLINAVSDADKIQQAFSKHCENTQIFALRNKTATKQAVWELLNSVSDSAKKKSTTDNTILFYFSGHGVSVNNRNMMVTYTTELTELENDTERLTFSVHKLQEKIQGLGANWRGLILFDSSLSHYHPNSR